MQLLALANSNDLANPVFIELGLVLKAEQMQRTGQTYTIIRDRGIMLVMPHDSSISDRKRGTALYRASAAGGEFDRMSLGNRFSELDNRYIKSLPLSEYKPVIAVGEICIYKHKSRKIWYVSGHKSGSPIEFDTTASDLQIFRNTCGIYYARYLDGKVFF